MCTNYVVGKGGRPHVTVNKTRPKIFTDYGKITVGGSPHRLRSLYTIPYINIRIFSTSVCFDEKVLLEETQKNYVIETEIWELFLGHV